MTTVMTLIAVAECHIFLRQSDILEIYRIPIESDDFHPGCKLGKWLSNSSVMCENV